MKGKLIVFDGVECSGKSTQIRLTEAYLRERGIVPVMTREPGGTPYAEEIRSLMIKGMKEGDPRALLFLLWAARADHMAKVVIPNLLEGRVIISDRFDSATYAYQICAQKLPEYEDLNFEIRKKVLGAYAPDLYLLFDIPASVVFERLQSRAGEEQSAFDRAKEEFHQEVANGFNRFARRFYNCKTINGMPSPEMVQKSIQKALQPVLNL